MPVLGLSLVPVQVGLVAIWGLVLCCVFVVVLAHVSGVWWGWPWMLASCFCMHHGCGVCMAAGWGGPPPCGLRRAGLLMVNATGIHRGVMGKRAMGSACGADPFAGVVIMLWHAQMSVCVAGILGASICSVV